MSICKTCGGKGKIFLNGFKKFVDCTECGGIKKEVEVATGEELTDTIALLNIPEMYEYTKYGYVRDSEQESKQLKYYIKESVDTALDVMDMIYSTINEKRVLKQCNVFYLGKHYNEDAFVYGCQYAIARRNLTTVPFISVTSLSMLARDYRGVNNRTIGQRFKVQYIDYLESDYVFLKLGAFMSNDDECILIDLINERNRRGLATCIFTYWSPDNDKFRYIWGDCTNHVANLLAFVSKSKHGVQKGNIDGTLSNFTEFKENITDIDIL